MKAAGFTTDPSGRTEVDAETAVFLKTLANLCLKSSMLFAKRLKAGGPVNQSNDSNLDTCAGADFGLLGKNGLLGCQRASFTSAEESILRRVSYAYPAWRGNFAP